MERWPDALELRTSRTSDLDDAARNEVVELCVAAHGEDDFRNLFSHLPPEGHVLAFLDGRLVGQAVVTSRWSQNGDGPLLKTAYVDAVSTSEDEQRRGIGSAVMTHLISSIDDFDIACLKTDVVAFYERLGWREWYGPLGGRADDRIIPTPEQTGLMLFRLARTPAIDPTQLLTIEAHAARIW